MTDFTVCDLCLSVAATTVGQSNSCLEHRFSIHATPLNQLHFSCM